METQQLRSKALSHLANLPAPSALRLVEFAQLRQTISGNASALEGLHAVASAEPGLAGRLYSRILPAIVRHAQALITRDACELAVHAPGASARTTIPRRDVAGWVALMTLGALEPRDPDWPHVDLAPLLEAEWPQERAKLRCVLAYFDRIADAAPRGVFDVERIAVPARTADEWVADASALTAVTVDASGAIEDADGCRQVDFANRFLGGGVLTGGCVQEEIRFAVAPELLAAMIVSPRMRAHEAIVMRGAERFARVSGYARALAYAGPFDDPCPRTADGTPDVELVAIDAVDYRRREAGDPASERAVLRELAKARSGFLRDARGLAVATGNWGCGVFGGSPPLKAVVQWLAASSEGRAVRYHSYGDARVGQLEAFAREARARFRDVGTLFRALVRELEGEPAGLYARVLAG